MPVYPSYYANCLAISSRTLFTEFFLSLEFSYSDAMVYYCLICKHRPKRIVEIGCGWSSLVALAALRANGTPDGGEHIVYVARRQTMTRAVINEEEITSMLVQKFQAKIVYLEDFTFAQQIMLFKNAKMIIGPHGGGLTNIIFCKPGTAIIEFQLPSMGTMYWHLAALHNLSYIAYVPKVTDLKRESGHFGSFRIDPEKLSSIVDRCCRRSNPTVK